MKTPNSFSFSSRVDIKIFASLTEFLVRKGLTDLTQSSVTRALLELLYNHLETNDANFRTFADVFEASKFLQGVGVLHGERNRCFKTFVKQAQEETLLENFGSTEFMHPRVKHDQDLDSCELGDAFKVLQEKVRERNDEFRQVQNELAKGGKPSEKTNGEVPRVEKHDPEGD